jgi:hypothetical protein
MSNCQETETESLRTRATPLTESAQGSGRTRGLHALAHSRARGQHGADFRGGLRA